MPYRKIHIGRLSEALGKVIDAAMFKNAEFTRAKGGPEGETLPRLESQVNGFINDRTRLFRQTAIIEPLMSIVALLGSEPDEEELERAKPQTRREYFLLVDEKMDGMSEQTLSRSLTEMAADGWRVAQMQISPSYSERGLAHNSDCGYSHKIIFLLERDVTEER